MGVGHLSVLYVVWPRGGRLVFINNFARKALLPVDGRQSMNFLLNS